MISILVSATLPMLLWPLEYFLPYPHVIEEIAKAGVVFLSKNGPTKILLCGILFTFTESVLYLFNIYSLGRLDVFFLRLIVTAPLHIGTFTLISWAKENYPKGSILAIAVSMALHYLFNELIVS